MAVKFNRVMFSAASDHWSTPAETYNALDAEFNFSFDPCPLGAAFDGLAVKWGRRVFCNPPYSNIKGFCKKATEELNKKTELVVFLVPSRTDTAWFHDYILGRAEIRFIRGRLKFGGSKNSAPFPSMICILRPQ